MATNHSFHLSPAIEVLLQDQPDPVELLAEMAAHPAFREKLRLLQAEVQVAHSTAIEDFAAACARKRFEPVSGHVAVKGAALARMSRRAGIDVRDRLQYSTLIMTAAILNRNNPAWNPASATTDKPDYSDCVVKLMTMDLSN